MTSQTHLNKLFNTTTYRTLLFLTVILPGLIVWTHRFLVHFKIIHTTNWLEYFGDFGTLYITAVNFISNGTVYGHGYAYLAPSVLLLLPLAAFSYENALIFKTLVDVACYAITIYLVSKIIKSYTNTTISKLQQFILFITTLISYPVAVSFAAGAVNAQVLVLLTITYYYLFVRKNITTASIVLSTLTVLKIIPFALVLLNKKLRIKTTILVISSCIIAIYFIGIEQHMIWLKYLYVTQEIPAGLPTDFLNLQTSIINTSIVYSIYKIISYMNYPISIFNAALILIILKIAIIMYITWFIYKTYTYNTSNEKDVLYFSLLVLMPLLLSNTVWIYYFPFLYTSIILWVYTFNLSKQDKIMLFTIVFLLSTHGVIGEIANISGGIIKTFVYIVTPITIASILMFVFIWNRIKIINNNTIKSD